MVWYTVLRVSKPLPKSECYSVAMSQSQRLHIQNWPILLVDYLRISGCFTDEVYGEMQIKFAV